MPNEPLFTPSFLANMTLDTALGWLWVVLAVIFIIHALIVCYHWFTYGSERIIGLISSIIYVGVGAFLLLGMGVIVLVM